MAGDVAAVVLHHVLHHLFLHHLCTMYTLMLCRLHICFAPPPLCHVPDPQAITQACTADVISKQVKRGHRSLEAQLLPAVEVQRHDIRR
jgi:hypothetical protein